MLFGGWVSRGRGADHPSAGSHRRVKYYKLTKAVERQLHAEETWERVSQAITRALQATT